MHQLNALSLALMTKFYIFAAVVLFWVSLSASLMGAQLTATPVHKLRVPTYRSMPIRSAVVAQVQMTSAASASTYN